MSRNEDLNQILTINKDGSKMINTGDFDVTVDYDSAINVMETNLNEAFMQNQDE